MFFSSTACYKKIESMLYKKDRCILIMGGGAIGLSIYLLLNLSLTIIILNLWKLMIVKRFY